MSRERDREQCLEKLIWASDALGLNADRALLEKIAGIIIQTMTGRWRYFHTPIHIFEVGGSADAIEVMSALFHDLVYVQVDRSVNFNLSYYITPFIREEGDSLLIRPDDELPDDEIFWIVNDLFGFKPGQALSPFGGMNEYLSALAGAKILEPFVDRSLIAQIVACIEATIPFRPADADGMTNSEVLYQRLLAASDRYNLGLSPDTIAETIRRSVRLANRDVGSFANPSPARFLDNTWSLLPETNHNLGNSKVYTVDQYRIALQKMEGFMSFLQPEVIFHKFRDEPSDEVYQALVSQARSNIVIGRLYLGSKLATIAFLEALSMRFGRDIPISMLMGEMPTEGYAVSVLADFLPKLANPFVPRNTVEQEVLTLLDKGRLQDFEYDIKNSPLTTYMVEAIGFDEVLRMRDRGKEFFQGKLSAEDYLVACDPRIVEVVTEGLSHLFDSRKAILQGTHLVAKAAV
jgi:hypothetical protein